MGGVQIQYLLGIYFIVVSISWADGRVSADAIRLVAGLILLVTAVLGMTLIS